MVTYANELKIKGYIKPDPLRGDGHYLIYNKNGNAKERIRPNPLWPSNSGNYLILDKKGNSVGRIRPDPLRKGQFIIEKKK
jgi:hypothetical protein